jgi:septal ring factor EnvC (AmiA/AmiB activator)
VLNIIHTKKVVYTILYICCMVMFAVDVNAQNNKPNKDELQKKIQQKHKEIELTQTFIKENKTKQKTTITLLQTINSQINIRENIIDKTNRQVGVLENEIDTLNATIIQLEKDELRLKGEYAKMIQEAYKNRNQYQKLSFVLSSKSFNQALKRSRYIKLLSENRAKQLKLLKLKQEELAIAKNKLLGIKTNKEELIIDKELEKKELVVDKKEQAIIFNQLKSKEKELTHTLKLQKEAARKLNAEIAKIIAREIEEERKRREEERKRELAANKDKENTSTSTTKTEKKELTKTAEYDQLTSDFSGNKNRLPWPVEKGFIIGTFGTHPHPTLKNIQVENNGIDISTQPGSKIRASFKGQVKAVFSVPGMQKCVMINHGDYYTVYCHLADVYVKTGDHVTTKQVIGSVYTDTEEERTIVHFEVWKNTVKLNPSDWLAD